MALESQPYARYLGLAVNYAKAGKEMRKQCKGPRE